MELKYVGEKTARKTKKEIRRAGFAATKMFAQRMSAGNMLAFLERGDVRFTSSPVRSNLANVSEHTSPITAIASTSGINTVNSNNKSNQSIASTSGIKTVNSNNKSNQSIASTSGINTVNSNNKSNQSIASTSGINTVNSNNKSNQSIASTSGINTVNSNNKSNQSIASTSGINTVNSNNKSNQSIATTTICNSLKSKPLGNPKETPPNHAKVIDLHSSPEPPKTSTMHLEQEDLDFKFQGGMILNEVVSCTETFGPSVDDLGSEHSTPRFIIGYHCF
uniref:Uncharacterized protein n=1 Tax=Timema genevievae TaxID=629358 RepID=A0A7R9K6U9_TIMGE|nr:unnamed protein product [Timema genevievae]